MVALTPPAVGRRWRVGVTQRRMAAQPQAFARDALDAAWSDWFVALAGVAVFLPIPNFADPAQGPRYLQDWGIDMLLLSGGEDHGSSPVRDALEHALLVAAAQRAMPVLGVCRGMQMLHLHTGGALQQDAGHVGTPHAVRIGDTTVCVNSWHRGLVAIPGAAWQVLATADDGSIEAMRHRHLPWLAVMWHPERAQGESALVLRWMTEIVASRQTPEGER